MKSFLEREPHQYHSRSHRGHDFIAWAIFASGLFVGSTVLLPHNPTLAYSGFIISAVTIVGAALKSKFGN